jgi:multiple sugar transport system permease protein
MAVSGQAQPTPCENDNQDRNGTGLLYIAPAMLLVIMFFVLPVIFTGWMSLHNWPLMGAQRWIGFNNYIRMFHDSRFMSALNFTAYYTVIVTIVIFAVAFPLALVRRARACLRQHLSHDHFPARRRRSCLRFAALGLARQCR